MKRKDTILQHTEYTKPRGKRCGIWRQGEVVWLLRVILFPIYKFWVDSLQIHVSIPNTKAKYIYVISSHPLVAETK